MIAYLEKYYETYRKKFNSSNQKIQTITSINKSYKYYANKNNILLKIMADSDPTSSIEWLNNLKKTVKVGQYMVSSSQGQLQEIVNSINATNQLLKKLPQICE